MNVLLLHGMSGGRGRRHRALQQLVAAGVLRSLHAPTLPELRWPQVPGWRWRSLLDRVRAELERTRPDLVVAVSMGARALLSTGHRSAPAVLVAPACAPAGQLLVAASGIIGPARPCTHAAPALAANVPVRSTVLSCPEDLFIGPGSIAGLVAGRRDVTSIVVAYDGIAPAERRRGDAHRMNFPTAMRAFEDAVRSYVVGP